MHVYMCMTFFHMCMSFFHLVVVHITVSQGSTSYVVFTPSCSLSLKKNPDAQVVGVKMRSSSNDL